MERTRLNLEHILETSLDKDELAHLILELLEEHDQIAAELEGTQSLVQNLREHIRDRDEVITRYCKQVERLNQSIEDKDFDAKRMNKVIQDDHLQILNLQAKVDELEKALREKEK